MRAIETRIGRAGSRLLCRGPIARTVVERERGAAAGASHRRPVPLRPSPTLIAGRDLHCAVRRSFRLVLPPRAEWFSPRGLTGGETNGKSDGGADAAWRGRWNGHERHPGADRG